jgi:tRNA (adenine57-N1/adenine58-N1)-methyltransferase
VTDQEPSESAQPGDLALLVGRDRKSILLRLRPGDELHTHHGTLAHDELVGSRWGATLTTQIGRPVVMVRPSIDDLVREIKRATQIVYPKDAGYVLLKMGIAAGSRVVEAGTGSGALTAVLALAVGASGHVYSYEIRPDIRNLAEKNLTALGLDGRVTLRLRDIADGFDESDAGAVFLDLPAPWDYLEQARVALVGGGFFGCILPTTNQVVRLLGAIEHRGFGMIEVEELLLRSYKPNAARLRPVDRMVAHTGYLVFARALT